MYEIFREFLKYCMKREGIEHHVEASMYPVGWDRECVWTL